MNNTNTRIFHELFHRAMHRLHIRKEEYKEQMGPPMRHLKTRVGKRGQGQRSFHAQYVILISVNLFKAYLQSALSAIGHLREHIFEEFQCISISGSCLNTCEDNGAL